MNLNEDEAAFLRWLVRRAWRSGSPSFQRESLRLPMFADREMTKMSDARIDEAILVFLNLGLIERRTDILGLEHYMLTGWAEELVPPDFGGTRQSSSSASRLRYDMTEQRKKEYMRNFLDRYFDMNGLKALCFELDVDYDNLEGETKLLKAQSLVVELNRRSQLKLLDDKLASKRPNGYTRQFNQL